MQVDCYDLQWQGTAASRLSFEDYFHEELVVSRVDFSNKDLIAEPWNWELLSIKAGCIQYQLFQTKRTQGLQN